MALEEKWFLPRSGKIGDGFVTSSVIDELEVRRESRASLSCSCRVSQTNWPKFSRLDFNPCFFGSPTNTKTDFAIELEAFPVSKQSKIWQRIRSLVKNSSGQSVSFAQHQHTTPLYPQCPHGHHCCSVSAPLGVRTEGQTDGTALLSKPTINNYSHINRITDSAAPHSPRKHLAQMR